MVPNKTQKTQFAHLRSKRVQLYTISKRAYMKCASIIHFLVVVTKHSVYEQYDQFRNKPIYILKKKIFAAFLKGTWCTLPLMATYTPCLEMHSYVVKCTR